jgi:hypothetical protein
MAHCPKSARPFSLTQESCRSRSRHRNYRWLIPFPTCSLRRSGLPGSLSLPIGNRKVSIRGIRASSVPLSLFQPCAPEWRGRIRPLLLTSHAPATRCHRFWSRRRQALAPHQHYFHNMIISPRSNGDLVVVMSLTRARAGAAASGAYAVSERVLEGSGVGPCRHWRRPVLFLDRACRMRRRRVKAPRMFPALPL